MYFREVISMSIILNDSFSAYQCKQQYLRETQGTIKLIRC